LPQYVQPVLSFTSICRFCRRFLGNVHLFLRHPYPRDCPSTSTWNQKLWATHSVMKKKKFENLTALPTLSNSRQTFWDIG
jgi:hypothetical protein